MKVLQIKENMDKKENLLIKEYFEKLALFIDLGFDTRSNFAAAGCQAGGSGAQCNTGFLRIPVRQYALPEFFQIR